MKLWELISNLVINESKKRVKYAGIFLPLPKEIAKHYSQKSEDTSPQHITILYFGNILIKDKELYIKIVETAIAKFKIGRCHLKKKSYFINHEDQKIAHNPAECKGLKELRDSIWEACKDLNLEIQDSFPKYYPHTTIEYLEGKHEKSKEEGYVGSFQPTHIEIWGFDKNIKIPLKA